jgi:hypothetical protein
MSDSVNHLKTRDDTGPVAFAAQAPAQGEPVFRLVGDGRCNWATSETEIKPELLRSRIEPWLTALCQSEHLSLLVGSGLTAGVHLLAKNKGLPGMSRGDFGEFAKLLQAEVSRSTIATGRAPSSAMVAEAEKETSSEVGNLEDQVRAANELLRGLEVLALARSAEGDVARAQAERLRATLVTTLNRFAATILDGERSLAGAPEDRREQAFNYLVSFLMSFASRAGTRDRLHLFTTNYDRFLEAGADVAGLRLLDRFVGSLAPVFRSSRLDLDLHYNPPGIRGEPRYLEGVARFTKLHGSLDWLEVGRNILRVGLPFGAESLDPYLRAPGLSAGGARQLMVYPNAAKDRETAFYPYVELFRDFAAAICRPNHTLVTYGFSFGDEHLVRVIEDMLTIPSTHLVMIAHGDPLGRILGTYERLGRHAQISLLLGNHLGDLRTLVDRYLPKPAIDRTTYRMAELLKARWGTAQTEQPGAKDKTDGEPNL